ncbi:MAG: hypothetical protein IMW93_07860 [Thermoanaerobacteraceae bacterium]|nr:hypothetical protein [Thermoanaerobacteraceae bacterium]
MALPACLKKFFWDVSFEDLDVRADYYFILERLLEYGDDQAIRWVLEHYGVAELLEVVKTSPRLSAKTGGFWRCYYRLKEGEIRCLRPPSHRMDRRHWNY